MADNRIESTGEIDTESSSLDLGVWDDSEPFTLLMDGTPVSPWIHSSQGVYELTGHAEFA